MSKKDNTQHEAAIIAVTAELFSQLLFRAASQNSTGICSRSRKLKELLNNKSAQSVEQDDLGFVELDLPKCSIECLQALIVGMSPSTLRRLLIHFMAPLLGCSFNKTAELAVAALTYKLLIDLFHRTHNEEALECYFQFVDHILTKSNSSVRTHKTLQQKLISPFFVCKQLILSGFNQGCRHQTNRDFSQATNSKGF